MKIEHILAIYRPNLRHTCKGSAPVWTGTRENYVHYIGVICKHVVGWSTVPLA